MLGLGTLALSFFLLAPSGVSAANSFAGANVSIYPFFHSCFLSDKSRSWEIELLRVCAP